MADNARLDGFGVGGSPTGRGGGVAVVEGGRLGAVNTVIHGNRAAEGGGVYVASDALFGMRSLFTGASGCQTLDFGPDTANRYCSELHRNLGGALLADDHGRAVIHATSFRANEGFDTDHGAPAAAVLDLRGEAWGRVRNTLFSENEDEENTVSVQGGATLHAGFSTFADENALAVQYRVDGGGTFRGNVVWDPVGSPSGTGPELLVLDGGPIPGACNIGDGIEDSDFHGANNNLNTDPLFTLGPRGSDYHLKIGSPALDQCAKDGLVDLDGRPRPNGEVDMGTFEGAYP